MNAAKDAPGDARQRSLPSTLPYYLMEGIRELIITSEFQPGEHLREQDLEGRFQSSRSPIREALRLLELKGLIGHVPRRGFRVRLMSEKEIDDLYNLRAELESYSIRILAGRTDLDDLVAALRDTNAAMKSAADRSDPRDYLDQNAKFHALILDHSENIPLRTTLEHLNEIAEPLRYNALSNDLSKSRSHAFHIEITEAISRGDFSAASENMHEHIITSLPHVKHAYLRLVGDLSQ